MAVINSVAFWVPGTFLLPGDDDKPLTIRFRARFNRLKKSERMALEHRIEANKLTKELRQGLRARLDDSTETIPQPQRDFLEAVLAAKPISDAEFVRATLADLDMKDVEGQPIIYTPNTLAELEEELDGFEGELVRMYVKARKAAEDKQGVAKNSETRSGTTSS